MCEFVGLHVSSWTRRKEDLSTGGCHYVTAFVGIYVSSWTRRKEDLRRAIKCVDKRKLPSCMWVRAFICVSSWDTCLKKRETCARAITPVDKRELPSNLSVCSATHGPVVLQRISSVLQWIRLGGVAVGGSCASVAVD